MSKISMANYKIAEKVLAPLFVREPYPLSVTETKEDQYGDRDSDPGSITLACPDRRHSSPCGQDHCCATKVQVTDEPLSRFDTSTSGDGSDLDCVDCDEDNDDDVNDARASSTCTSPFEACTSPVHDNGIVAELRSRRGRRKRQGQVSSTQ
jgi:hypothetical protein